jgi:hypothetical protein
LAVMKGLWAILKSGLKIRWPQGRGGSSPPLGTLLQTVASLDYYPKITERERKLVNLFGG